MIKKVILITGASSGFGKACAEYFSKKDYKVYGTSRESNQEVMPYNLIQMDVNDDASVKKGIGYIIEKETGQSQTVQADFSFGKLTIAATLKGKPFSTPFKAYNSAGKQVLNNWTQKGQLTEMLAEGIYTVKVTSIKDNKQVVTFENINIVNL